MKIKKEKIIEKAKNAKRESKYIEFKDRFHTNSLHDWCEIIKDIIAMANSGGGYILFGVNNDGTPSIYDISSVLKLDPAIITDKIAKYTGQQFSDFEIEEIDKNGHKVPILIIYSSDIPIIFTKPGTYQIDSGKQKAAFGKGTIYFRHGAKSEPGNSYDLLKAMEKKIEEVKKSWLTGIRKVVTAPIGHVVQVLPPNIAMSTSPNAIPARITNNKEAPTYRLETPDETHPYRQKEVIERINEHLKGKKRINQYDILCVRRVYSINKSRPDFYYKSKYGVPQYSELFVNWLVESYEENPMFFDETREKYRRLKR